MRINYFIVMIILYFCSACTCKRSDKAIEEVKSKEEIIGRIDKAYINLHLPIDKKEKSRLFYECSIVNRTSRSATFKFHFFSFEEKSHKLYAETIEYDSIALTVRSGENKIVEVAPGQTRKIDFCVDFTSNLLNQKDLNNYLFQIDSLAFVTNRILYMCSNDSIFEFTKSKDYLIEHRPLEYYTESEEYKE